MAYLAKQGVAAGTHQPPLGPHRVRKIGNSYDANRRTHPSQQERDAIEALQEVHELHHDIYYSSDRVAACLQPGHRFSEVEEARREHLRQRASQVALAEEETDRRRQQQLQIEQRGHGICQKKAHDVAHRRIKRGVDPNWHSAAAAGPPTAGVVLSGDGDAACSRPPKYKNPILDPWGDEAMERDAAAPVNKNRRHFSSAGRDHFNDQYEAATTSRALDGHAEHRHYGTNLAANRDHIHFDGAPAADDDERKHFRGGRKHFRGGAAAAMVDQVAYVEFGQERDERDEMNANEYSHSASGGGRSSSENKYPPESPPPAGVQLRDAEAARRSNLSAAQNRGHPIHRHLDHGFEIFAHQDGPPHNDFLGPHKGAQRATGGSDENYDKIVAGAGIDPDAMMFGQRTRNADYIPGCHGGERGRRHFSVSADMPDAIQHRSKEGGPRGEEDQDAESSEDKNAELRQEGVDHHLRHVRGSNVAGIVAAAPRDHLGNYEVFVREPQLVLDPTACSGSGSPAKYARRAFSTRGAAFGGGPGALPGGERGADTGTALAPSDTALARRRLTSSSHPAHDKPYPLHGALAGVNVKDHQAAIRDGARGHSIDTGAAPSNSHAGRGLGGQQAAADSTLASKQRRAADEYRATNEAFRENQARAAHGNLFRKNYPDLVAEDARFKDSYSRPDAGHFGIAHLPGHPPAKEPLGTFPHWQTGGRKHGWNVGEPKEQKTPQQWHTADHLVRGRHEENLAQQHTGARRAGEPAHHQFAAPQRGTGAAPLVRTNAATSTTGVGDTLARLPLNVRNLLGRLRSYILRRNPSGTPPVLEYANLSRLFRADDPDFLLSIPRALAQSTLRQLFPVSEFSSSDLATVLRAFSVGKRRDHSGEQGDGFAEEHVDYEGFVLALRPQLLPAQRELVEACFERLGEAVGYVVVQEEGAPPQKLSSAAAHQEAESTRSGGAHGQKRLVGLRLEDLKRCLHPKQDPRVLSDTLSAHAVVQEFLRTFDAADDRTGIVTKEKFVEYYQVHAELFSAEDLEILMRRGWCPPPPTDATATTSGGAAQSSKISVATSVSSSSKMIRRGAAGGGAANPATAEEPPVVVDIEFHEGDVMEVRLINDVGLDRSSTADLVARLRRQGIERESGEKIGKVWPAQPAKGKV